MSELHVPLTTVTEVRRHPNADKLDIAVINGWQVVVGRDSMKAGDPVIYVGPDCVVPAAWAEKWGVASYLDKGRVKAIKLRGEPSFGFAVPLRDDEGKLLLRHGFVVGQDLTGANVADAFGITKYAPPLRGARNGQHVGGPNTDSMREHPSFTRYTDIVNLRHYPQMFGGAAVVVTEKIHGTNSRIGYIQGTQVAGSHRVQRRHPNDRSHLYEFEVKHFERHYDAWRATLPPWKRWTVDHFNWPLCPPMPEVVNKSNPGTPVYWLPFEIPGVDAMLESLAKLHSQVILYGELYGPSIQALGYGVEAGKVEYRAFDLMIDGKYPDYRTFAGLCDVFQVPMVPLLTVGTLDYDEIKALSEGATTLNGGPHHREGVVVRTVTETYDPRLGRMVAKLAGDSFLTTKGDAAEDLTSDVGEAMEVTA